MDRKDQQAEELSLFKKWKSTGDKRYFQQLYTSMKNLIHNAGKKATYGSNIPETAHKIWSAQNFLNALNTYDPTKANLSTHVYGSVEQKAKRLNYQYQNLGSIPEPRAQIIGLYNNEYSNARDALGREPSTAEMADRMNTSTKQVSLIQKELRKDLAMSGGTEEVAFAEGSRDEELLNYLYYDLGPEEKLVYEYMFGKFGKPRLVKNNKPDFDRIASKVGMSVSKIRSIHAGMRKKLEKLLK